VTSETKPVGLLIKGHTVALYFDDETVMDMPKRYGIVHDPVGTEFRTSDIFFASYKMLKVTVPLTKEQREYYGDGYQGEKGVVDIPNTGWHEVKSGVTRIDYYRTGESHPGPYWHPFYKGFHWKKTPLTLYQSGLAYLLRLPEDAVVNERGFVFP
jgi:hypothetical protein